jgi:O-antigen ligase
MVISTIDNKKDLNIFIFSIILMYAYLAYEPMYGFITGTGGEVYGYGTNYVADIGILDGHVALANNMNQMIPLTFFMAISQKKKYKKVFFLLIGAMFVLCLIGSNSRGGFIGFVFFCGLVVYFLKAEKKLLSLAVPAIALVFILSASFLFTASRIHSGAVKGRLEGLAHGIEIVRVYGHVLGVGPGCFAVARGRYFGMTMDSHNLYGQVIGELGIPGSIAWVFLIWQTLKNFQAVRKMQNENRRADKHLYFLATGLLCSMLVRLFVGLGSHGLYFFYWYIIIGISALMVNLSEEQLTHLDAENDSNKAINIQERYKKTTTAALQNQLKR